MPQQYLVWINKYWQIGRVRYWIPILKFLTKYKVTSAQIVNSRLILGFVGLLLYLNFSRYSWAIHVLLIANILGILSGALAKYQNTVTDRSRFLEVFVDYILYAFLLALVYVIAGSSKVVGYNLFIIPVLYLLATIKKQEFLPSDWLIKVDSRVVYVKAVVVVAFFAHWYVSFGLVWIDRALALSNVLATVLSVYYFLYIQLRWKKFAQTK